MSETHGVHCPTCGIYHTDPRLTDPPADLSIDVVGDTTLCPVYSDAITQQLLDGRNVTFRFLEGKETLVIQGMASIPLPSDTVVGRCNRCNRAAFSFTEIGTVCNMTQPDQSKCQGRFQ